VSKITIVPIGEKKLDKFIDVPYRIFAKDPFWVPELKDSVKALLSLNHPFWLHGSRKLFVAMQDGKPVGRIAAIINDNHNKYHNERCGFFGFFDTIDNSEVSYKLLYEAKSWLAQHGMDKMRGPMNPSTNESCGLLISGFESDPTVMMPYNPPYYVTHLEAAGFYKAKDLYAFIRFTEARTSERLEKIIQRAESKPNIRMRDIRLSSLEHELDTVRTIYNDAWSENWGFVPLTPEEITVLGKTLRPILKPEYACFIEVDNEPAAFALIIPDINVAIKPLGGSLNVLNVVPFLFRLSKIRQGRLMILGVKKAYRKRGLELLLIKRIIETARKCNWTHAELSWTLEDNDLINNIIEEAGGKLYKKYRIYETPLLKNVEMPSLSLETAI